VVGVSVRFDSFGWLRLVRCWCCVGCERFDGDDELGGEEKLEVAWILLEKIEIHLPFMLKDEMALALLGIHAQR